MKAKVGDGCGPSKGTESRRVGSGEGALGQFGIAAVVIPLQDGLLFCMS